MAAPDDGGYAGADTLEADTPPAARKPAVGTKVTVWGGRNPVFANDDLRLWLERMAARGLTVPEWPKQYGGVTGDFDIGLFLKRARVAGETFGDDYFQKERLARTAWRI